ncbi:glycosyltransferase family protein [Glutamicibacter sp. AOP3-A1-12]|uniref:glycosyltransferase family protein n=1 Tax=Glutamicibacter sp. AOP3-A1-12 TaxID=3457701 RepID=UPI00403362D1
MDSGKSVNFSSNLEEIEDHLQSAADSDKIKTENALAAALEKIMTLRHSVTQMDDILENLRKQARSLQTTGFANLNLSSGFESEFEEVPTREPTAQGNAIDITTKKQSNVTFPPYKYPDQSVPKRLVKVASILDKFSESAFSYEWENVALTKSNWREQLTGCDLLFVESAWSGNNNEWRYCLTGASAPRPEVIELVNYAKEESIPTIFWNKEDPPHFADFLRTAALFDVVLTTDDSCVDRYKEQLKHDNVGVLPFAAQPKIHNPIRPGNIFRNKQVSFGGMYFAHKYPERRAQMEYLLPAAAKFDFDIFSRQLGGDEKYQFPEPFDKNVVGSLEYEQMLTAYHAYNVFLNVNSVTSSSTMCARRIFEILASGAAIVSAPSPAIEAFFPNGLVPMPETEEEAYSDIRALLQPGGYRAKLIQKAQRKIWAEHTFAHRVGSILEWAGKPMPLTKPSVSVIAPTFRPDYIDHILQSVGRQVNVDLELNLLLHGFDADSNLIKSKARDLGIREINVITAPREASLGENLNRLVAASSGEVITKMDDDDYYGANYLEDLLNARMYSGADIVGKAASYIHFESKNATILSYAASENRFVNFVRGATLTASRDLFLEVPFRDLKKSEDSTFIKEVLAGNGTVYAADRFNFWVRRSSNSSHHTWTVEDRDLFATGPVVSYGNPDEYVGA